MAGLVGLELARPAARFGGGADIVYLLIISVSRAQLRISLRIGDVPENNQSRG